MAERALRFNVDQFAWRHDLDDRIVVYCFGGSRVLVLRGGVRERFIAAVERGERVAGLERLVEVGVLRAEEGAR